jgi:hypothetical protein
MNTPSVLEVAVVAAAAEFLCLVGKSVGGKGSSTATARNP